MRFTRRVQTMISIFSSPLCWGCATTPERGTLETVIQGLPSHGIPGGGSGLAIGAVGLPEVVLALILAVLVLVGRRRART